MATKGKIVGYAVKYGVKYGPHVVVAAKALKEPATAYAQKRLASLQARRAALAEAATLAGGSALKVFHDGGEVWVVYAGEQPITTHPAVDIALERLVERADLSLRVVPEPPAPAKDRLAAAGGIVADQARKVTSLVRRDR